MRKSLGGSENRCSTSTRLGPTKYRRPSSSGGRNASYWPSTLRETYPRSPPTCAPSALRRRSEREAPSGTRRCASGSSRRCSPRRLALTHSPRDITHGRERNPPSAERPVKSTIRPSAVGTTSARSSRMRARSIAGVGGPEPPPRRPASAAVPQSTSTAAREPMDQSIPAASITGRALALGLLAGGDHRGAPSLTLGDAAVRALVEQLGQDAVERLLVEADLLVLAGGGSRARRRGGCLGRVGRGWRPAGGVTDGGVRARRRCGRRRAPGDSAARSRC